MLRDPLRPVVAAIVSLFIISPAVAACQASTTPEPQQAPATSEPNLQQLMFSRRQ